ncbi:DUF559 domain-containing protein [Microbacteriaceae bacterium VKM Ac-2854]|nr:DUF559 domain-containing protein [Microbacteriaceae bacterium VKM Ac-2854]
MEPEDHLGAISRSRALSLGKTDAQLRSVALSKPFHGVRTSVAPATHLDLARAYVVRMRKDQFFSHLTALVVWGAWLSRPVRLADPLHVGAMRPLKPPQTRNVIGHQFAQDAVEVVERNGLRVSDPASTWISLASTLSHRELVATADYFLRVDRSGSALVTLAELEAAVEACRGAGVDHLRNALPLLSTASASRPESLLRLLLREKGFPEFVVNEPILGADGEQIAIGDLVNHRYKLLVEYDGGQHLRSEAQRARDRARRHDLEVAGWMQVIVVSGGLDRDRARTVREVRDAFRSHGWVG